MPSEQDLAGKLWRKAIAGLFAKNGFQVLHHVQVPPNDGGISLGQIAAYAGGFTAARAQEREASHAV